MRQAKKQFVTWLAATLGLIVATAAAVAQGSGSNNPPVIPPSSGGPTTPAGTVPTVPKAPSVVILSPSGEPSGPARPSAPSGGQAPAEVKDKVEAFKKARESYLAKQRELAGANRQQLTEQQRQALLENIKANQQELRSRIEEIKTEFRNRDIDTVIDDVKRNAGGGGGRPRRGED